MFVLGYRMSNDFSTPTILGDCLKEVDTQIIILGGLGIYGKCIITSQKYCKHYEPQKRKIVKTREYVC